MLLEDPTPGLRFLGGARHDLSAPGLDQRAPVRLLFVRDLHHVELALEADQLAGEREGAPPLPRAGLRRQAGTPFPLVVKGLRYSRVGLVTPGRADALVLVEDARAGPDRLLEPSSAEERRRPPEAVELQHLVGDGDLRLLAHLLPDQLHRKERRQIVRPNRLPRPRMQHRLRSRGHVGANVVPTPRKLRFLEQELRLTHSPGTGLHAASIERRETRCDLPLSDLSQQTAAATDMAGP